VRIRVDAGLCQGHARCAAIAPALFDLDDEGYAFVRPGREDVPDGDLDALLAIDNGPEQAIGIDEAG
jgi:ferredoxin